MNLKYLALTIFPLSFVLFTGCLSVPQPERIKLEEPVGDTPALRADTLKLLEKAVDEERVNRSIEQLEQVLSHEPTDLEILARLSNLYIFKGAAYETRVKKKRAAYVQALRYSEAAMMTSADFRRLIDEGVPVWEAVKVLDESFVPAMSFWSTALFYQFDECLNKLYKPMNLRWVRRSERVLSRAYALDPDWGGGQLHFAYGIYYLMPAIAGGDLEKSKDYFGQAVEAGPGWLLNRWGRARYLYNVTGNKAGQIRDFEWVIAQNPQQAEGPIFWNLYCQRDAQEQLDNLKSD